MSTPTSSPPERSTMTFDEQVPAVTCEQCGYPTARIAHLVNPGGGIVGIAVVCTRCTPPHRHREYQ